MYEEEEIKFTQKQMDLDAPNLDEDWNKNIELRLKYEQLNETVAHSRHFNEYIKDKSIRKDKLTDAGRRNAGNMNISPASDMEEQISRPLTQQPQQFSPSSQFSSEEQMSKLASHQAQLIYHEIFQGVELRNKDKVLFIVKNPLSDEATVQVLSEERSAEMEGLMEREDADLEMKQFLTSEQVRMEIAEYMHRCCSRPEEMEIEERSVSCLMTILQKKYGDWTAGNEIFVNQINVISLIDSFAAKEDIEVCQQQEHQVDESEVSLLSKLVRFPNIKKQILKNIYTKDYLIGIFEEIIKLNIQQTSLNVLVQMSLKEKIQLLFQRAKIVIDTYKNKLNDLKRTGQIAGTSSKADVNQFQSPNLKNRRHFNFSVKFGRSAIQPHQLRLSQDLNALNNGILGLLNKNQSVPSSHRNSFDAQSKEHDHFESEVKGVSILVDNASPQEFSKEVNSPDLCRNDRSPEFAAQLRLMEIDNHSSSYNTPKRSINSTAHKSSMNKKSIEKRCLRVTHQHNEKLSYDEMDIRGLLAQYNCFLHQNCIDDDEVDDILGQIQQNFEDLKRKYINLLHKDDLDLCTNLVEQQQHQLEITLLQVIHYQKMMHRQSQQQSQEIDSLKAELQKSQMDKDQIINLQQKQEIQEYEHREQTESKDQQIEDLIDRVQQLQKDYEVQVANMERVQQALNEEREQNKEDQSKLFEQQSKVIDANKRQEQVISELRAENRVLDNTLNDQLQQCKMLHIKIQEIEQSKAWNNQLYEELYKKYLQGQSILQKEQIVKEEMQKQIYQLENVNKGLQVQVKELEAIQMENYDQQDMQLLNNPAYIIQDVEQVQSDFQDVENFQIEPKSALSRRMAKNSQFSILDRLLNENQVNNENYDNKSVNANKDIIKIRFNRSLNSNNPQDVNSTCEIQDGDNILDNSVKSEIDIDRIELDDDSQLQVDLKVPLVSITEDIANDLKITRFTSDNIVKTIDNRQSFTNDKLLDDKQSLNSKNSPVKSENKVMDLCSQHEKENILKKEQSQFEIRVPDHIEVRSRRPTVKNVLTTGSQLAYDTFSISEPIDNQIGELQAIILGKKLIYNIVCDRSLPSEQTFLDDKAACDRVFERINSLLQSYFTSASNAIFIHKEAGGQRNMIKTKAPYLMKYNPIGPKSEISEFYLEKLHIWDQKSSKPLKQILLLIHRGQMFFIYLHKNIFFMQPISIFSDIDHIVACTMSQSKNNEGGDILFDIDNNQLQMCDRISMIESSQLGSTSDRTHKNTSRKSIKIKALETDSIMSARMSSKHRFICIQLKQSLKLNNEDSTSQIFLVQHNQNNIDRLSNFINYHRLGICTKMDQYDPLEVNYQSLSEKIPSIDNIENENCCFQMIQFDPDMIDIDNEAALEKPKKRVKIYSDIFLTQKKSYFSFRTQMINSHCHLLQPSEKALIVIKKCMQMEEMIADTAKGDSTVVDMEQRQVFEEMMSEKIERLLIENHGPNYRMQFAAKRDTLSLQKAVFELTKLFQYVLLLKIGHEDVNKNKVSQCLVLNKTLKVTNVQSAQNNAEKQKELCLEVEQYYYCPDIQQTSTFGRKSSLNGFQKEVIDAGIFDLKSLSKKSGQKTIQVKQNLFQKMATDQRHGGVNSHNEAIFDKWHDKMRELIEMPIFNEKRHRKQTEYYQRSLHKIKSLIYKLITVN